MSRRDGFRILLDTNIILDAVCPARPQSKEACLVLRRCSSEGDMGFVTSGSLKDAYYVLSKQYGEPAARAAMHHLMGLLIVAPTSAEDCLMSLESNEPDFEDGLIRACAELNDMDFIITRDEAAFRKSKNRWPRAPARGEQHFERHRSHASQIPRAPQTGICAEKACPCWVLRTANGASDRDRALSNCADFGK